MSAIKDMKSYKAGDGTNWGVDVQLPSSSSVLVVFHHPDGRTARKDRYAWLNWQGAEANNAASSVSLDKVRASLDDATIRALFTRSMIIGAGKGPAFSPA